MLKTHNFTCLDVAADYAVKGAGEILPTSVGRGGTRARSNLPLTRLPLTRAISDAVDTPVTASAGVAALDHLVDEAARGGASEILTASNFHFDDHTIGQAKQHLANADIPMRLE